MARRNNKQIFIGRIVHSKSLKSLEIFPRAALGVSETGRIQFLDSGITSAKEAREKYDGFGNATCTVLGPLQFLFPGLIDTHLHAPQWPNLAIGMEGDLREWIEHYTDPIEASYSDSEKAKRIYDEMVQKELELGTTTCAYNSSMHHEATNILADTCKIFGQRAIVGKMCVLTNSTHGNWEVSTERSLEDSIKCVKHIQMIDPRGELILPSVQPRGGPFCPPTLMGRLGEQSQNETGGELIRVQAHMCETVEDTEKTMEMHPGFACASEVWKYYGLLHGRSILAHCIHLSERDMELLVTTKAGVAHNPNSNVCLTDGFCRVRELLDRGVKVGLGTDCSAGYSTFMLDSMRQASNVSRSLVISTGEQKWKLTFEEIVYLGTLGGATVLALEDRIGNFEPGKCFDALVVDVGLRDNINVNGWESEDLALVKKWVFLGDDRSIRKVFVNGKLVAGKDTQ